MLRIIHHFSGIMSEIMSVAKHDGSMTASDYKTANLLNSFSSVFTEEPLANVPTLGDRSSGSCLYKISITHDDTLNELVHSGSDKGN